MNNNHNTHFYSLEEAKRILETTKEFEDGEQIYYFIGALRYLYDEYNKQKEVLNKIKEELTGDFNFEVYICNDNKGSGKTMKLGASIYRNMILEKLNELLEEIE